MHGAAAAAVVGLDAHAGGAHRHAPTHAAGTIFSDITSHRRGHVTDQETEADEEEDEWDQQFRALHKYAEEKLCWSTDPERRAAALLFLAHGLIPDVFSPYGYRGETTAQELWNVVHQYPGFTQIAALVQKRSKLDRWYERMDKYTIRVIISTWERTWRAPSSTSLPQIRIEAEKAAEGWMVDDQMREEILGE